MRMIVVGAAFLLAGCEASQDNVAVVSNETAGTSIEDAGAGAGGSTDAAIGIDHHSGEASGEVGGSAGASQKGPS